MPICAECGAPVTPGEPDALEEAVGWTKDRARSTAHRKSGGLHHLRFWRKTGRWMCGRCARAKAQTGNALQASL
jgi:hypothetical protein